MVDEEPDVHTEFTGKIILRYGKRSGILSHAEKEYPFVIAEESGIDGDRLITCTE